MPTPPRPVRWAIPAVLLLVWLAVGGAFGPYAGKLGEVSTNDQAAFPGRRPARSASRRSRRPRCTPRAGAAAGSWTSRTRWPRAAT
ncbi:hypothetical protein AB0C69_39340, partial [Actinomadura sp. NPDC048032]|uniref:hypothetical protein n=1 Tax=Actinomadura sp. NPDC048032 TaxID=3155747 RepID=UPI0033F17DEB